MAVGNIFDLQTNGYAEKAVIYGANGLPVDWGNLSLGSSTPARSRYTSHFITPGGAIDPGDMVFELSPYPGQLKAIKITNSFYIDLFAQITIAPDVGTFTTTNGHAERFLVGSMQTVALEGEDLFAVLPEIAGQRLYIRFSTELYEYAPLSGTFPTSQRVVGNSVCLFG